MKTQRKQQRGINSIATGRWTAYMAAAAASTFAGAGSAEAEIHYSGDVHIHLVGDARASLPLSNGASLVFENFFGTTFIQTFTFVMKGVISGSARGVRYFSGSVRLSNLGARKGVSVGRFLPVTGHPDHGVLFTNWSDGQFAAPADGFVAFRFNTGNGTQYGWARIKTETGSNYHVHDLIKDYAWGDVGDAILTGQKHSLQPANTNSVPGSLGLLAFGAQGLDAWRTQCTQKSN
jgi:hypothetical protein